MRAGDAHGPERKFDVEVAFESDGIVRSMKMRALDNAGAYAGRAPFQLGKPISAIVGPYQIGRFPIMQFRSPPTNCPRSSSWIRPGPTNYALKQQWIELPLKWIGSLCQRNLIRSDQFPYLIRAEAHTTVVTITQ